MSTYHKKLGHDKQDKDKWSGEGHHPTRKRTVRTPKRQQVHVVEVWECGHRVDLARCSRRDSAVVPESSVVGLTRFAFVLLDSFGLEAHQILRVNSSCVHRHRRKLWRKRFCLQPRRLLGREAAGKSSEWWRLTELRGTLGALLAGGRFGGLRLLSAAETTTLESQAFEERRARWLRAAALQVRSAEVAERGLGLARARAQRQCGLARRRPCGPKNPTRRRLAPEDGGWMTIRLHQRQAVKEHTACSDIGVALEVLRTEFALPGLLSRGLWPLGLVVR